MASVDHKNSCFRLNSTKMQVQTIVHKLFLTEARCQLYTEPHPTYYIYRVRAIVFNQKNGPF
jgi:hypothetical protein